jgi:DNA-binding beta-propeller fold protein YncE
MRRRIGVLVVLAVAAGLIASSIFKAAAVAPGNEHFQRTWARTDQPVLTGQVSRTWMWGPEAFTDETIEEYIEGPGGYRAIQYFDKARMEITNPSADPASIWYVTNGLLVVELITGQLQAGDNQFLPRQPAQLNVAGDDDDPSGPTYATFGALLGAAPAGVGTTLSRRVSRTGQVTDDPALASQGQTVALIDEVTNHAIAAPFWSFMTSSGTIWDGAGYTTAPLFENAYFATGRPITEAYWANVKVGGAYQDVLIQCFERRCLTYNPANASEWRVEAGNVGRHYHAWRYGQDEGTPTPTEPPVEVPVGYEPLQSWGSEFIPLDPFGATTDVAVDPDGDVWLVDATDNRIMEFDAVGRFKRSIGSTGLGELQFSGPQGLSIGFDGRIYVADTGNDRIQVINHTGTYVTAWGEPGAGNGQLDFPTGVHVVGELVYVADSGNDRIQLFNVSGSYLGQWGSFGSGDGQFSLPAGVTTDSYGNVYVTDANNSRVQIFTASGAYLHQFGTLGDATGQFRSPRGIAVDPSGNVYVADSFNHRIQVFAPGGIFKYQWGHLGSMQGAFNMPLRLALTPDLSMYVADSNNSRVQKLDSNGSFQFEIRDNGRGLLGLPADIVIDENLLLLVADGMPGYERIRTFTTLAEAGLPLRDFAPPSDANSFNRITSVAIDTDAGKRYVTDSGNNRIQIFSEDWSALGSWGEPGSGLGQFDNPRGIAVDVEGYIYVVDSGNNRIQKFNDLGQFVDVWGGPGSGDGQFDGPTDIAVSGLVYITDTNNNRVQMFTRDGDYLGQWGGAGTSPGRFDRPLGIAADVGGYIFVVDNGNGRIQKFDPNGQVVNAWGTPGQGAGQLNDPWGIAVDGSGHVYVTDRGNYRVQVFRPALG